VWDRVYSRTLGESIGPFALNKDSLGDQLGILLIEAYLQDNKPGEADEIFNAVLGIGGRFKDISRIVELAKAKGFESLASRWQAANDKR
jgi:hypothetical protein